MVLVLVVLLTQSLIKLDVLREKIASVFEPKLVAISARNTII
jgi:hypothetical protein